MMRSTQELAATIAATLYSYIKPAETDAKTGEYKKPSRATVAFSKNMTASIALPGRVIKIKKAKAPKKPTKAQLKAQLKISQKLEAPKVEIKEEKATTPSSTSTMLTYLLSFVPASMQPILQQKMVESKEECKSIIPSFQPVVDEMKNLESQLPEFLDEKAIHENLLKLKNKKNSKVVLDEHYLNVTIAEQKEKIDAINLKKVELVAELIQEHAKRRVDLFFYLLLAVRGKMLTITKTHTVKQHGVGSKEYGTNACHSSLFPNLKFEMPKSESLLSWIKPEVAFTLKGTHFEETLNMTMELPKIVNEFDCRLESIPIGKFSFRPTEYVKKSLRILNQVSRNEIDIPAAMHDFFIVINQFFTQYEVNSPADKKIWEYQRAGTFTAANHDFSLKNSYLHTMLRLDRRSPPETKELTANSTLTLLGFYSPETSEVEKVLRNPKALPEFYQRIQNEILAAKVDKVEKKKRNPTVSAEQKPVIADNVPEAKVRRSDRKR